MNDDKLLFSVDDIERWKRRELPSSWLDQQGKSLCRRFRDQFANLTTSLSGRDDNLGERTDIRL